MFEAKEHLNVKYDYTTCHNVNLLRLGFSKTESDEFIHPILHTNKQTWYSRIRPLKKVSGHAVDIPNHSMMMVFWVVLTWFIMWGE